jgi:glycosyltransferase involved in cell wall biosynthesis
MDRAILQMGGMDLIHAHVSYPAGYVAAQLSERYSIPYVLTEHMSPFPFPGLMRDGKPIDEVTSAFASATATVAVSPALADQIETFGYRRPIVIPNLVDEREFRLHPPHEGRFTFLSVSGMTEQKGIDDLLKAVALWDPPASAFEFLLVGDGPKLDEWKRMADGLGISDRVRWLGGVERRAVGRLFMGCNAFVLPSRHETFGVVLAEAAASGKPLVATRCGGPESIVNETNGLLVDVGDVGGLADALHIVSSEWPNYDPEAIRQDCLIRFGRRPVIDRLTSLYQSVLDGF